MSSEFVAAPVKPAISIETCEAIDVRVGTILSVEAVAGTKKLMALRVSFGSETRTIVAGIRAEREDPTEIVGRQALFVVNLPPRRMYGVESQGKLFDIGYADGLTPVLACPERPVPDGARAG